MTRLITIDDIIDTLTKGKQRGWGFIISKFTFSNKSRTKSAFNESSRISSNWSIIPYIKERWNLLITGNTQINYKQFLVQEILKNETNLKLLSLGSGSCSHEIELANYEKFKKITCIDLSEYQLSEAAKIAEIKKLNNIEFICSDLEKYNFPKNNFDIILFNSSLHHFNNVESLLSKKIMSCLKDTGKLVINEYVGPNRLQFTHHQIKEINKALKIIPRKFRKRYKTKLTKNIFFGSGILRMVIADPSECIDSINILPSIHKYFETIVEKPYGGNILMNVLKDISHHFVDLDKEKIKILDDLFQFEDEYLLENSSDFIFGVYKKLLPTINKKH